MGGRLRHYGYADARQICLAADVFQEHGRNEYDIFVSIQQSDASVLHLYVQTTRSDLSMREVWSKLDNLLPGIKWKVSLPFDHR